MKNDNLVDTLIQFNSGLDALLKNKDRGLILYGENISRSSLVVQLIKEQEYGEIDVFDAKHFKGGINRFSFSLCDTDTSIVIVDGCDIDFDYLHFYYAVDDGIFVEENGKEKFKIHPKFIFLTQSKFVKGFHERICDHWDIDTGRTTPELVKSRGFRFRAECIEDVYKFSEFIEHKFKSLSIERFPEGFPDVNVSFTSFLSLEEIRYGLSEKEDLHVILQTIDYEDKYSGERNYELN